MAIKRITRRKFLRTTAVTAVGLATVPRHVLGGPGQTPPSEVITRGVIGTGGQGMGGHVTVNEANKPPVTLAVCDVDRNHLDNALKKAARGCDGYGDFRRVIERKDIDVIHIATPPHWHAIICIAAADAGKDVLCEKPMTKFIAEGQAIIDAIKRNARVFQIGTYGRFGQRRLRKLIASGLLGSPLTVRVSRTQGFDWKVGMWSGRTNLQPRHVPEVLNYDMWLGPAPAKPYHPHRVHQSFRGYWDYDGGGLADMGQHHLDPLQYALGKDDTSPIEIEADAPWPSHPDAVQMWGEVRLKYADGTTLILNSGEWGKPETPGQAYIEGPKGKVFKDGRTNPAGLYNQLDALPDPPQLVSFYDTSVRERKPAGGNERVSHRSACLLHLANTAIRLGRKLKYDPDKQRFVGDDEANRLVNLPMRAPWRL